MRLGGKGRGCIAFGAMLASLLAGCAGGAAGPMAPPFADADPQADRARPVDRKTADERVRRQSVELEATWLYEQAMRAYRRGDYQTAADNLREALRVLDCPAGGTMGWSPELWRKSPEDRWRGGELRRRKGRD